MFNLSIRSQTWKILIGFLFWICVFPVLFPFLVILSIWSGFVSLIIIFKNAVTNPSPFIAETNVSDTMYCLNDPTTVISYALVAEGFIKSDDLRRHFQKTFLEDGKDVNYPVFHHTFSSILGYSVKIRAPLDLVRHIREENFNPHLETENEAYIRVTRDYSNILGAHLPKWEVVLLHNRKRGGSTLIFKISHALADGYSARILLGLLTENQEIYRVPWGAQPIQFMERAKIFAQIPVLTLQNYWNLKQSNFGSFPSVENEQKESDQFKKVGSRCHWSKKSLDFSKIKKISNQTECRITSVVTSLYISALKKTLKYSRRSLFLDETLGIFAFPAPAPHPADSGQFCNHIVPGLVNLPLTETDSVKQLFLIHERLENYETSQFGSGILLLQLLFGPLLPKCFIRAGIRIGAGNNRVLHFINPFIFSPTNYKILEVPCSSLFYLCGIEEPINFKAMIFTPLTTPGNQMNFSVHGPEEIFRTQSDAERFMDNFVEEVELLLDKVIGSSTMQSIDKKEV